MRECFAALGRGVQGCVVRQGCFEEGEKESFRLRRWDSCLDYLQMTWVEMVLGEEACDTEFIVHVSLFTICEMVVLRLKWEIAASLVRRKVILLSRCAV